MRKVVVSSTLTGRAWNNTTVVGDDAVAGVRALKAEAEDGPIPVNGSETLVHTLSTPISSTNSGSRSSRSPSVVACRSSRTPG